MSIDKLAAILPRGTGPPGLTPGDLAPKNAGVERNSAPAAKDAEPPGRALGHFKPPKDGLQAGPPGLTLVDSMQKNPGTARNAGVQRNGALLRKGIAVYQMMRGSDARTLYGLVRTWGTLSTLFGLPAKGEGQGLVFDPSALWEMLETARRNAEEMERRQGVVNSLKSSALAGAEALVQRYYGLKADGAPLKIVLEEEMGGAMGALVYRYDRQGRATGQELHLNLAEFTPDTSANGVNDHIIQNDRIVAHEMTHAIMGRTLDFRSLPTWFTEGTAEYIAGGMERVALMLHQFTAEKLIRRLDQPWTGDSPQYAAAYLSVRYMDHALAERGGLKAVIQQIQAGATLDEAITTVSDGVFQGIDEFLRAFIYGGEGEAFLRRLDTSGRDPGSINHGAGPDVVPDRGLKSNQPLRGFHVQWPSPMEGVEFRWSMPQAGFTPPGLAVAAYRRQLHASTNPEPAMLDTRA